jgi:hypothetical protein
MHALSTPLALMLPPSPSGRAARARAMEPSR